MTPTTLLMTTDAVGGLWTYTLDLAEALRQKSFRVTLAVLGPGLDPSQRTAASNAGLDLIETQCAPDWLARDETEVAQTATVLGRIARDRDVDLVHLNHPAFAALARFDGPVLGVCHSCVGTWWDAVKGTPFPTDLRWRTDLVGRGYRAAHLLVAPSRAFGEATQRVYGLPTLPDVVHNGRAPDADAAPERVPADAVFTAGRLWDEGKDLATLDRVAALTSAPVRAAGSTHGPDGAAITLDHIEALGDLRPADMRQRFAERPIYVSTALFEPFGLAVLEAAQAGCALVLSDIASFRELWDGSALFVPPRDHEAFAAAIGRLLSDPDLRADYAHAAQNRARAFGLDAFAEDMANLYRGLLAQGARKESAA